MQEEASDFDDDPLSSEGVFVDSTLAPAAVSVGDLVRLTGTVSESTDSGVVETQIRRIQALEICESNVEVEPVEVMLPFDRDDGWEAFEGMLVTLPQELTVTQLYNLGRYQEVMVAVGGRLYQPTNVAAPGADADAIAIRPFSRPADSARRILSVPAIPSVA